VWTPHFHHLRFWSWLQEGSQKIKRAQGCPLLTISPRRFEHAPGSLYILHFLDQLSFEAWLSVPLVLKRSLSDSPQFQKPLLCFLQPPIPAHMFSSPRQFKHAPGSHVVQSLPPPTDPVNAPRKEESSSGGEPSTGIRRPQLAPVPKQRLRWTPELHERFIAAVTHLGGGDSKLPTAVGWTLSVLQADFGLALFP
jgi:SHAQKYF class myb-like DNA-binding protein